MRQALIQSWRRFSRLIRGDAFDADMQEEFRHHLQLETEHLMATHGMTAREAARVAVSAGVKLDKVSKGNF
jgi:hypothetical protein